MIELTHPALIVLILCIILVPLSALLLSYATTFCFSNRILSIILCLPGFIGIALSATILMCFASIPFFVALFGGLTAAGMTTLYCIITTIC